MDRQANNCSATLRGGSRRAGIKVLLLLLLAAAGLLGLCAHPAQAQEAPVLGAVLLKTVGTTPGFCPPSAETSVDVAPGATVYICYTLVNTGTVPIEPFALIDNFGLLDAEAPVDWTKPPGFVLEPKQQLTATAENGLIRAVTAGAAATTLESIAGWGIAAADGSQTAQITSNAATINVVALGLQATLTGSTAAGASATTNCSLPVVTLTSYQLPVYLCVTLTNASSITLTQHQISIPGFGIDVPVTRELGPAGSATTPIRITSADSSQLAPRLTAPTMTSRAYITSTNAITGAAASLSVSAVTEPVVVNGPAASVQLQKTVNTVADPCSTSTTLSNVAYGQTFYYCLVLINSASLTFTEHVFTEPALKIAGAFNAELRPGGRITVTNNTLAGWNVTPFLGPFTATQTINNNMVYTASNPSIGYRAVFTASASITVLTPTPTNTGAATPTNTPIPFDTPIPTPTITPIPPTPTPTWTWTPSPTPTPSPTVLIFSTPGGLPPTPYPTLAGLQAGAQPNQFVSPLQDPFAATATAQALFGFPTPVLDPFGATATAQAQFAFPTPVLDPFGATATAQAQFAFPTPVLDPFAATATAQAQFAFPTPVLDPFAATATAQTQAGQFASPLVDPLSAVATATALALFSAPPPTVDAAAATAAALATPLVAPGTPGLATPGADAVPLDAFAATAVAQAATIAANAGSLQTAAVAVAAVNGVMTVTATFTPQPAAALAQRPVEPPAPPAAVDTRTFFVRVLDSAGSTVAVLWFLGGSLLFFITAGVLAGLSFRAKESARFALEPGDGDGQFVAQPAAEPPPGASGAANGGQSPAQSRTDDNWPDSLP